MTEKEIKTMADAMIRIDEISMPELEKEATLFSKKDEEARKEDNCIEAYARKRKDIEDVKSTLKTKYGYKKVEQLYGDVAVVSDAHYKMGVVSVNGDIIVPFGKYGWIGPFREDGTAPVRDGSRFSSKKDAKWGVINQYGEEVKPLKRQIEYANNKTKEIMNEDIYFSINDCHDYEGNFDYEKLEDAIMDGEYVPEDW